MKKIFLLFLFLMFFLSPSTSSKACALTFESINTGTIRDLEDDGTPNFIEWPGGTVIEVDERTKP